MIVLPLLAPGGLALYLGTRDPGGREARAESATPA
jgi:hypothetical protein